MPVISISMKRMWMWRSFIWWMYWSLQEVRFCMRRGGKVTDYGTVETDEHTELYDDVDISEADLPVIDDILSESDVAVTDSSITEILHEETDMIVEEVYYDINELEIVELPYEPANKLIEAIVEGEANLQTVEALDMPKKRCEALTDKQKVEWLGIAGCSVREAIQRFISKLDSIGVVYQYSTDMLDEFMKLESVMAQMKRKKRCEQIQRE